jgi:hypothetical protein
VIERSPHAKPIDTARKQMSYESRRINMPHSKLNWLAQSVFRNSRRFRLSSRALNNQSKSPTELIGVAGLLGARLNLTRHNHSDFEVVSNFSLLNNDAVDFVPVTLRLIEKGKGFKKKMKKFKKMKKTLNTGRPR